MWGVNDPVEAAKWAGVIILLLALLGSGCWLS